MLWLCYPQSISSGSGSHRPEEGPDGLATCSAGLRPQDGKLVLLFSSGDKKQEKQKEPAVCMSSDSHQRQSGTASRQQVMRTGDHRAAVTTCSLNDTGENGFVPLDPQLCHL